MCASVNSWCVASGNERAAQRPGWQDSKANTRIHSCLGRESPWEPTECRERLGQLLKTWWLVGGVGAELKGGGVEREGSRMVGGRRSLMRNSKGSKVGSTNNKTALFFSYSWWGRGGMYDVF